MTPLDSRNFESASQRLVLWARSPVFRRRTEALAAKLGLQFATLANPAELSAGPPPVAIVLELELPGAIQAIERWKQRWPDSHLAGAIAIPNQELWIAANAAGCDIVANIGALPRRLERDLLARQAEGAAAHRETQRLLAKRVENHGDGLVGRLPDAPDGPIAVFRAGSRLCAFRDVCPHAGYSLSDGQLLGHTITCPAHGSQFDVCSGERLRGPADFPIQAYRVVVEGDDIYVDI